MTAAAQPTTSLLGPIGQIALQVPDVQSAVRFYRDVLGLRLLFEAPPGLAFFDLGSTRLIVNRGASSALLYFDVADIDAGAAALADRGVELLDEPHMIHRDADGRFGQAGGEEWMVFFRDSEQNMLALAERRAP